MSSDIRLGPTSYVVLGITELRGPSTSYELKRFVQLTIGHFWPFPHTQLYAEPARLAEAGLLEETREESGRRRRHYAITDAGRERLVEWLVEPVASPTEFRDLGLLKLFFGELAGTDEMLALAQEQAAAHRAKLAIYDQLIARYGDRPAFARRLLSVELGIRLSTAAAGFWDDVQSAASASASTASGGWPASMTDDPLRLGGRELVVGGRDRGEEAQVLLLEPVGRPAGDARQPDRRIDPQQQRPVGPQAAGAELVERPDLLHAEPAPCALVGERGVDEAVEQDGGAGVEQRPQLLGHELRPRGGVQERLGPRIDVQREGPRAVSGCARTPRPRRARAAPSPARAPSPAPLSASICRRRRGPRP